MTIRLIAVDLDGTLLTSPVGPEPSGAALPGTRPIAMATEGARLLKAAGQNGVHVILATARAIDSVRVLCRSLELSSPVICANGAQIYDSINGPLWRSITFPRELGLEIATLADRHGWELATTIGDITYFRQRPGQVLGPFSPGRAIAATNADAVTDDPTRILAHDRHAIENILALCRSSFSDKCSIDIYHGPDGEIGSLGIFGLDASKGNALDLVLQRLGVSQSEVMAIGDDINDLPMFSRARIQIAMSNGHEQLKEQATAIAPSNDDEGVAWALREFGVST